MSDTAAVDEKGAEEQAHEEQQQETEAKARKQGWVPKDEFHGAEDDWKPAEEWLAHGETERQRLRREKAELEERFAAQDATLRQTQKTLEEFKGYHERVEQRAYDRALKDLKAKQRDAVEAGDTEAYDAAEKEIKELDKDVRDAKPKGNGQDQPAEHPDFVAWKAQNSWYTGSGSKNLRMRKFCDDMAEYVAEANPGLKGRAFFDKMTELVKEEFPEQFENPRRDGPSAVEGAGSNAPTPKGKRTYANLPPEARASCDEFVDQGLLTREQYVADYEWD